MPRQIDLTTHINKMGRWTNKENAYETDNNNRLQDYRLSEERRKVLYYDVRNGREMVTRW